MLVCLFLHFLLANLSLDCLTLGGPSYGDIQTALWKALKIAGKRKPHNNLV